MSKLYIVDIKKKNHINILNYLSNEDDILALTPFSVYILEKENIKYLTFHDLISIDNFRKDILDKINQFKKVLLSYDYLTPMLYQYSMVINYFHYIDVIKKFLDNEKYNEVIYITDIMDNKININSLLNNKTSLISKLHNIKTIYVNNLTDYRFYINKLRGFKFKRVLELILSGKIFIKDRKNIYKYDNMFYKKLYKKLNIKLKKIEILDELSDDYYKDIISFFYTSYSLDIEKLLIEFIDEMQKEIKFINKNKEYLKIRAFTYLTTIQNAIYAKSINKSKYPAIFYQHGNYLYNGIFLKESEINLADINFVINDYTKKIFENLGAKKVYSVGSLLFNQPILEKKKKYDFLYITQGHDYMGNNCYVDFNNSLHSMDGYKLYKKHLNIINIFGKKFPQKTICIKVHPGMLTSMLYVPLLEISKIYCNVTIETSSSIHNLIEKSKYIISDYFTTDFTNRELHYKRDILMFQGEPTPLPKETIEDMKKMFILVDNVDDLEEKIQNIEEVTKNRERDDEIIEYYSSNKCDTKKVVTQILEKEFNGR